MQNFARVLTEARCRDRIGQRRAVQSERQTNIRHRPAAGCGISAPVPRARISSEPNASAIELIAPAGTPASRILAQPIRARLRAQNVANDADQASRLPVRSRVFA
jgi:hypothetical protein